MRDGYTETRLAEEITVLERRLERRDSASVRNRIAVAYGKYGRLTDALKAVESAIELDAAYLPSFVNKANILALQGNYADAAAVLMELLAGSQAEIAPQQQFHILILLAGLHFSAAEYEEASANYRSAARIDPRLAGDYRYLAGGAATDGEARASSAADIFSPSWFVDEESDGE